MRLPYSPPEPQDPSPETAAIYERIKERRNPRPLTKLDLALLYNPQIADGWNTLLGAIRSKTTLPAALTELAVCRIAVLNGATYEWHAHAPLALKGGLSREALQTCRTAPAFARGGEGEGGMSGAEWAIVRYTDAMTKEVTVKDEVFEGLKAHFDERQIVELTATVATYNCVSRFLVALDVCEMNGKEIEMPKE